MHCPAESKTSATFCCRGHRTFLDQLAEVEISLARVPFQVSDGLSHPW